VYILDQWSGRHVSVRQIRFHPSPGFVSDGRNYYVVE
jgi:hypothetical protein